MRAKNYKPGNPRMRQTRVYLAQKLARCTVCGELLRGNPTRDHSVYRDASPERGIACTAQRRSINGVVVAEALADFVASIQLPEDWQATALAVAVSGEAMQRQQSARDKLERQLARLQELKYDPDTDLHEWRTRKATVEAELSALQDAPDLAVDIADAANRLAHLSRLWTDAIDEERREIVTGIVDAVWCDLDKKKVVAIQPREEFYPLRAAFAHMSHGSTEPPFTLDNDGCTMSSRSGTDGIRPPRQGEPIKYVFPGQPLRPAA